MDVKSFEKPSMDLPPYSLFPKTSQTRKNWILLAAIFVLLIIIMVGACLTGAYMTQKHNDEMVTTAFTAYNGEHVQQTASFNDEKKIVVIFSSTKNYSATVLYDYNRGITVLRHANSEKCFVMKMDEKTPSMGVVITGIKQFQSNNTAVYNEITYGIIEGEKANPINLGFAINLLCHDASIFWASMTNTQHRWKISINIKVWATFSFGK